MDPAIEKVLYESEEIDARVTELAREIRSDFAGKKPTFIVMIKGATVFASDLARKIPLRIEIEFISSSSYGSSTKPGDERKVLDLIRTDLTGRNLLIVEDIVDTGWTVKGIIEILKKKNPSDIAVCAFLDKPSRREVEIDIDYVGYEVPDHFVVGYGLDFNEEFRNLPYIGVVKDEYIKQVTEGKK